MSIKKFFSRISSKQESITPSITDFSHSCTNYKEAKKINVVNWKLSSLAMYMIR